MKVSLLQVPKPTPHWRHVGGVGKKLVDLRELLCRHDRDCWAIGDLCVELVDRHRLTLAEISRSIGYARNRLSEMRLTSGAFLQSQRNGYTFQDSLMARRVAKRMPQLGLGLLEIRDIVTGLRSKRPSAIRDHFIALIEARDFDGHDIWKTILDGPLENLCHLADWRQIVPRLPDGSVTLLLADPPYGGYEWAENGAYRSGRSGDRGVRSSCDADGTKEAMEVTLPLFELCHRKMVRGGCLVLFQPAGPDRPAILKAAGEHGWRCAHALTWQKTGTPPGGGRTPYITTSERILVFSRANEQLTTRDRSLTRSDVLNFACVAMSPQKNMDRHVFQKPDGLMDFFIRKHSSIGELVLEPFGCSGAGCIAASKLGRRWVYVESNEANFRWGHRRLAQTVSDLAIS